MIGSDGLTFRFVGSICRVCQSVAEKQEPANAAFAPRPDPRTMECIERLIAFDTVSRNSNLELIDWARQHLEGHGATIRMDWSADRQKANMLASFGEGAGGIVLSGHTDVVPVDGQAWTSDPFKASVRDGKLFGRGACDMKGFVGVVLGHADRLCEGLGPRAHPCGAHL